MELQGFVEDEKAGTEVILPPVPKPVVASSDSLQALQDRLSAYVSAEQDAIQAGESSKARRYKRAIKV